jgi:hypothetical protein
MTWPYPSPEITAPPAEPTWECPDGLCQCHPHEPEDAAREIAVLLRDDVRNRMPGARCRIWFHGRILVDEIQADAGGWVRARVPSRAKVLYLEWAPASLPLAGGYPISKHYIVDVRASQCRDAVRRRLANIGHHQHRTLAANVREFQIDRGLEPSGDYRDVDLPLQAFHDLGIETGATTPSSSSVSQHLDLPDAAPAGGGSLPTNRGTAQYSSDFPTPRVAEAQGKTFHEFQSAGTSVVDPQGKEWRMFLLMSRDGLKWEVPTETVRGPGVTEAEGKYWERVFKDLTNPDPIIPSGSLNPFRTIRLPSSAEHAQRGTDPAPGRP